MYIQQPAWQVLKSTGTSERLMLRDMEMVCALKLLELEWSDFHYLLRFLLAIDHTHMSLYSKIIVDVTDPDQFNLLTVA